MSFLATTDLVTCSFGMAPSALSALPISKVLVGGRPALNIKDMNPMLNVKPFGMCTSLANPMVQTATLAAMGVLTPMPCIPQIAGTWIPVKPTVMIGGMPIVNLTSKCMCVWGGLINLTAPAQTTVLG